MNTAGVSAPRAIYRSRLEELITREPDDPEDQSHWAKYICVLISGYLEQSVKDVLLEYSASHRAARLQRYLESTWPESRNMKCANIREILNNFEPSWAESFDVWLRENDQYKSEINSLIGSRNDIAHGKEANTTNVTLRSTKARLRIALELVDFLENRVLYSEAG